MICCAVSVLASMIHLKDQMIQTVDLALADMELIQQRGPMRGQKPQLIPSPALLSQFQKPLDVRFRAAGVFQIADQEPLRLCIGVH